MLELAGVERTRPAFAKDVGLLFDAICHDLAERWREDMRQFFLALALSCVSGLRGLGTF